ncbi:hypothetical protein HJFPF1_04725 [Paramyrothecium foliicola]|nr:hypothetical protein HJFPF1_04725 [Paramyrothecium foliicola]
MRLSTTVLFLSALTSTAANAIEGADNVVRAEILPGSDEHDLYKRRGGGGGGGRGGGGGSSGGGSRGGSGGSRGGSGSSRPANTQPSSNRGGTSPGGSGTRPAFGGGRYYGGGAPVPYPAGRRTRGGYSPLLLGAGIGALAFWPGVWLYGAYMYDYDDTFRYHNVTTDQDETRYVKCACDPYSPCGCDEEVDELNQEYLRELVGNGSYAALDKDIVDVARVDGRMTLLINGTLENGTTADGPAEADGSNDDGDSPAVGLRTYAETLGLWPVMGAAVVAAVFMT